MTDFPLYILSGQKYQKWHKSLRHNETKDYCGNPINFAKRENFLVKAPAHISQVAVATAI